LDALLHPFRRLLLALPRGPTLFRGLGIWMICRRRAIRSASGVVSASARGRIVGLVATANRAITPSDTGAHRSDPSSPACPANGRRPNLRRIDHHDWQASGPQAGRHHALEPARRLHRNHRRRQRPQPRDQLVDARRVTAHRERLAGRQQVHIQPGLRLVNATRLSSFSHPCLNGLRLRPRGATVRVRWNGGRRPRLRDGLDHPMASRATDRHRAWHSTR
jgi:hypothetical protein